LSRIKDDFEIIAPKKGGQSAGKWPNLLRSPRATGFSASRPATAAAARSRARLARTDRFRFC
jgi:hypothetical protein